MKISTLQDKKLDELRAIARELDLSNYSTLRKQDLIYRILEAQAEGTAAGNTTTVEEAAERSTSAEETANSVPDRSENGAEHSDESAAEQEDDGPGTSDDGAEEEGKPAYMQRYD